MYIWSVHKDTSPSSLTWRTAKSPISMSEKKKKHQLIIQKVGLASYSHLTRLPLVRTAGTRTVASSVTVKPPPVPRRWTKDPVLVPGMAIGSNGDHDQMGYVSPSDHLLINGVYYYIPGTQMSLVLIGKDLVLEAKQRTNGFQGNITHWS